MKLLSNIFYIYIVIASIAFCVSTAIYVSQVEFANLKDDPILITFALIAWALIVPIIILDILWDMFKEGLYKIRDLAKRMR